MSLPPEPTPDDGGGFAASERSTPATTAVTAEKAVSSIQMIQTGLLLTNTVILILILGLLIARN
ncbi:hypothetical protein Pla110_42800 [Polystyrenella longa]|uniref:Uncharacterized protein n=1 Tax=Polystyrenella longa TaxID=2528007 RepID=A0A518CTG0_9PLAN|nr:hypothetical protein Pla110_42800 [Polystyrenella longa]